MVLKCDDIIKIRQHVTHRGETTKALADFIHPQNILHSDSKLISVHSDRFRCL